MGAASLTSCEDFLTVDSPSQFDTNYVFSNENDAKKVLLGAYQLFCETLSHLVCQQYGHKTPM